MSLVVIFVYTCTVHIGKLVQSTSVLMKYFGVKQ